MHLHEIIYDFIFEKDEIDPPRAGAGRKHGMDGGSHPPLPDADGRRAPGEASGQVPGSAAEAEMHWLDDDRILSIFGQLGIDETYGGELDAVFTRCDPPPVSGTATATPASVPGRAPQPGNSTVETAAYVDPEEEIVRQKRVDVYNAINQLTLTEERLLRNYEELVRTRAKLIESEQKVRAHEFFLNCVISDAREGIVAFDRELRYTLWNRFMEIMTGIPSEKVLGQLASEVFPVLKVAGADLLLERAYSGDTVESSDISFLAPMSGKQVWVRVIYSPLYDASHAITGVIGIIQDTTARKVMEYALQTTIVQLMESESKYRNVFNARNLPVLIVNTGSHAIIDLNVAAVQLYGWSREEMLGMSILDLQADPKDTGDIPASETPHTRTCNQRKKDGSLFPADVSADYFTLRGITVTIFAIRDLSSSRQVSESLRVANTKLNLILGITRHDVLNNLTAVWGYNEMLQSDVTDQRCAEMLRKQEKALVTIRNQLEFTREYDDLGMREPQWQNISALAQNVLSQFIHTISFSCTTGDLEIYADPLLDRVLYNLFDNSIRYGGAQLSEIRISCRRVDGGLDLWFEDNGTGIMPGEKERIFSRGFGKHTGMGLFLTREILILTRIAIHETGTYGKGACFEFHIPEGGFRYAGTSTPALMRSPDEELSVGNSFGKLMEKNARCSDAK